MIRVLVAMNPFLARDSLVSQLRTSGGFEVVADARDAKEAIDLARSLAPDVIALGLSTNGLDVVAATKEIMATSPTPIVVFSDIAEGGRGDPAALEALRAGAVYVARAPGSTIPAESKVDALRCADILKAMAQVKVVRHWRRKQGQEEPPASPNAVAAPRRVAPRVVAIASSTGGPAALQTILGSLPSDFPLPILVAQHITEGFVSSLARWLDSTCSLRVKIGEKGENLQRGTAYVAPDGTHMGLTRDGRIELSASAPVRGFRPSGTYLFRSVARHYGAQCVAVILTGMGDDGVEGMGDVKQAGGTTIAQDEATSVVFGMPRSAADARVAGEILPLHAIAARLTKLARN